MELTLKVYNTFHTFQNCVYLLRQVFFFIIISVNHSLYKHLIIYYQTTFANVKQIGILAIKWQKGYSNILRV